MRKILLLGHDGELRLPYENSAGWREFVKVLEMNGFEIAEQFGNDIFAVIANSHKRNFLSEFDFSQIPIERRILILWEPYVVETERYDPKILNQYSNVYAPSPIWAEKVSGRTFKWPQEPFSKHPNLFINWEQRKAKVVMIQGNKFSARRGELYSLRRRILAKMGDTQIDLFGPNWNSGIRFDRMHFFMSLMNSRIRDVSVLSFLGIGKKYRNYKGPSADKFDTLQKYQVSLVIENSADFVSEKLFDSVRAGCLVIYVGPNLERFGLSSEIALCCKASPREIVRMINQTLALSVSERLNIAERQRREIERYSEDWNSEAVLLHLANSIISDLTK